MANTKKYVSLDKLGLYDEKIKAKIAADDAATLASAKTYADGLAKNYDAAGAAATAESNAKGYTDTEVAKANGAAATAQAAAEAAAAAAAAADGKAVAAQGEVDALETYVGTFTHDTAKSVVEYINAKTDGIATSGNLEALAGRVTTVEGKVATIEANYLDGDDKTELEGKITEANTAVATEKARAEGIEAGLRTDVDAIVADYLKAADKTELQGNIDEVAGAVERLTNGVSTEEIDGVNDLIAYVNEHGTTVKGMQDDIAENAAAIAAEAERAKGVEATNAAAAAAAKTAADEAAAAVASEAERATGVEGGLNTRLLAVEAAVGESGSVADDIATAKQEAIDAAAADATSKANAAEAAAKGHADGLNTAMNTRVEALEAIDHDHSNKAELDLIASGDKAKWDTAAGKAHEHANKTVLDGITAENVTAWGAAEGNAKTYADGLNTAMGARVTTLENWHNDFVECSQEDINALFNTSAN